MKTGSPKGSKVAIAASCFSISAYQELKEQLNDIDELRFIFTSPSFVTEKADKQKREFYIPRLNRERDLFSFFEGDVNSLFGNNVRGLDDFELICFLVIK